MDRQAFIWFTIFMISAVCMSITLFLPAGEISGKMKSEYSF